MKTAAIGSTRVRQRPAPVAGSAWPQAAPLVLNSSTLVDAYGAHRAAAYRLAYSILADGPAAEDAVQDTFIKLWTGGAQFDPTRGPILGLVLTIARHMSIDGIRRQTRRRRVEGTYSIDESSTSDGPERTTEREEEAHNVKVALLHLPSEQRAVVELAYFSGLTRQEIAAAMTIPVGTVKSRMRLAMRKLASALGDEPLRRGCGGDDCTACCGDRDRRMQGAGTGAKHDVEACQTPQLSVRQRSAPVGRD